LNGVIGLPIRGLRGDPIEVIENVMRYFYAMGLQGVKPLKQLKH
jgi:hypothetical protein